MSESAIEPSVTPAPAAPLTMAAYARHRGVDPAAVLLAIQTGRLATSIGRTANGRARIVDVALADQEWAANTDPGRPGREGARVKPGPVPQVSKLAEASTREKNARARIAELEYRRRAGELVERSVVERDVVDQITQARTKVLAVPSKMKLAAPHLTHADILLFDSKLREALEDIANTPARRKKRKGAA